MSESVWREIEDAGLGRNRAEFAEDMFNVRVCDQMWEAICDDVPPVMPRFITEMVRETEHE